MMQISMMQMGRKVIIRSSVIPAGAEMPAPGEATDHTIHTDAFPPVHGAGTTRTLWRYLRLYDPHHDPHHDPAHLPDLYPGSQNP